ncbi:hypothetical protein ACIQAD_34250 [Streptomyces sp. NPDC088551]|uniref:hypothetical protein n=1 Tax=Streptomyces sp. NPDC088551 TaxID=3365863 RepID=UPI003801F961
MTGAGRKITNDLYHGETWTIDLKNLTDTDRADLLVDVAAWDDAIDGIARPSGTLPSLPGWTWNPMREVVWA